MAAHDLGRLVFVHVLLEVSVSFGWGGAMAHYKATVPVSSCLDFGARCSMFNDSAGLS